VLLKAAMKETSEFREKMQRVEALIGTVEASAESDVRSAALELVRSVMDFHSAAVDRMMEIVAGAGAGGFAIFDEFVKDNLVANLLMLYGLHPLSIEERVLGAIEKVRPSLSLHEGDVELLGVSDGVVRLRLRGSCDGCPSSALTLKHTIEEAILQAAPDVVSIEVDGAADPPSNGLVQIGLTGRKVYSDCEFAAAT
jgi:Fe-S cluster biogenesis protein NfuA